MSTNGITANCMFCHRGTFWVLPLTYFYTAKSARVYLFPHLSKIITFAAAPLVLTPFVRNQLESPGRCSELAQVRPLSQTFAPEE